MLMIFTENEDLVVKSCRSQIRSRGGQSGRSQSSPFSVLQHQHLCRVYFDVSSIGLNFPTGDK